MCKHLCLCVRTCVCVPALCLHTHTRVVARLYKAPSRRKAQLLIMGCAGQWDRDWGWERSACLEGEPMARTEPHGGQGRASEKGQAGRRPAPHWVQVTGAVAPPGWLTPAPLGHTQRPGLRWGSNSTSLATTGEGPGGGSWPRGRGPARLRVAPLQRCSRGTVSLGLQAPCLVLGFPYPNLGHCGIHHHLPILGSQGRWPISTQAPSGPRLSHHPLRAKLPCCRETLLVSGPHPFGQPLP